MKTIKAIRTDADHALALARIEKLIDAEFGTAEGDELDVLTDLVELYEEKTLKLGQPSPIAAIKFRMEQGELSVRDLIPLIGSRAKVSEVLAGKRDITMPMARALHEHLGIPAGVLLQRSRDAVADDYAQIQWERFPTNTLMQLGWIERGRPNDDARTLLAPLAKSGGGMKACSALFRKTRNSRANTKTDSYALIAWCWYVRTQASKLKLKQKYLPDTITHEFLRELAKLSRAADGPIQAQKYLAKHGIALVVVRHLPRTYLDGAAMKLEDGRPVVAMTLRYDRIDNFWFCLFHELAHIAKHLDADGDPFFDDLSLEASDTKEEEADKFASEGLIPEELWGEFDARKDFSPLAVVDFADKVDVHPAIVAGRIRHQEKNYRLLSQFVGLGQIRNHFRSVA
jgi:HTH-type transcriptional regulator / antitoxin HigA